MIRFRRVKRHVLTIRIMPFILLFIFIKVFFSFFDDNWGENQKSDEVWNSH